MILNEELKKSDILQQSFPLPEYIKTYVLEENWKAIDDFFLKEEKAGGLVFNFFKNYLEFTSIEHIISIRRGPDDEDGIWHDDGSRILGFTISLSLRNHEIKGGYLRLRNKNSLEFQSFSTRDYGEALLFKTGIYGHEHMVTAVTQGERILIAGWCS